VVPNLRTSSDLKTLFWLVLWTVTNFTLPRFYWSVHLNTTMAKLNWKNSKRLRP